MTGNSIKHVGVVCYTSNRGEKLIEEFSQIEQRKQKLCSVNKAKIEKLNAFNYFVLSFQVSKENGSGSAAIC